MQICRYNPEDIDYSFMKARAIPAFLVGTVCAISLITARFFPDRQEDGGEVRLYNRQIRIGIYGMSLITAGIIITTFC